MARRHAQIAFLFTDHVLKFKYQAQVQIQKKAICHRISAFRFTTFHKP